MTPLIDATEMYLRTVWELEEEGITPIRARLVERLGLSAPAVSETVARLEVDGLMRIGGDRTLELTDRGRELAVSVMRKHRLAELLLTDVIGMEWAEVHNEACRWEHVISDAAEERIAQVLGNPAECPYGNPIPGSGADTGAGDLVSMTEAAKNGDRATIRRISEHVQVDVAALRFLHDHDLRPGADVMLRHGAQGVVAARGGAEVTVDPAIADLVYVAVA
jgi:DtxR family transcriptional regulator, Mn-dependent transcriptional regulator